MEYPKHTNFIGKFFKLIFSVILCLLIFQQNVECRSVGIMQITFNNLKNVLNTYQQIYVLFHNPQCEHSSNYREQFLKIKPSTYKKSTKGDNQEQIQQHQIQGQKQQKINVHEIKDQKIVQNNDDHSSQIQLGIVDCLRQIQLCQHFSLKHFPTLIKVYRQLEKSQYMDQQQFLVDFNIENQNSDNYLLNKFISFLKDQQGYAVVVLEQEGLPVQNRLDSKKNNQNENDMKIAQRVFYLEPSTSSRLSNFSNTLLSFVDQKTGCWIFSNKNKQKLQKFYCNDGQNPEQIKQYVNLFRTSNSSNSKKFVFSELLNQKTSSSMQKLSINAQILYETIQKYQKNQQQTCRLIYFFSNNCKFCSSKDIIRIKSVLTKMNLLNSPFSLNLYDIQKNQIPSLFLRKSFTKNKNELTKKTQSSNINIKRLPEMIYICNKKMRMFGQVFFQQKIQTFINENYYGKSQSNIEENLLQKNEEDAIQNDL